MSEIEEGNVTAIVPASMKDKVIIQNATHTYSEVFNDNFDNTKVAVVILILPALLDENKINP